MKESSMRQFSQESGFTFVELLISTAVVIVLAAIMLGPTDAAARKKKFATCAETMRKLHLTLTLYANEHDGAFPVAAGARKSGDALGLLVPAYTSDGSILGCEGGGYSYVMGMNKGESGMLVADRLGRDASASRGPATFSERGNHDGNSGNVLFVDGHVEQFGTTTPRNLRIPAHAVLLNP